ncbi:hypothetical protein QL285_057616 [Trifolium repens]|nr:hypothetical protein QL285_057616 [Trifolium repens]
MPPKRDEKGRRNRIATRVVTPPPGVRLVPMPTSSSTAGQFSTHTAPSIQITQVSTQSLPYPTSFISPQLPFGPPPAYPQHIYPPPGMQVPQQFNYIPIPAMEVPQQTQNPDIDLNDDQEDDVPDVEEDDIPDVEEDWKCTWDERDHDIIERNFHIRAAARMSDILRQVRKKFKKKGIVPQWICTKLFKDLQAYWESSEFVDVSNEAKKNIASEKGGCIYAGGSLSVADQHGRRLANKLGRKPFIDELHLETHTSSKGGFVDERSRKV